MKTVTSIRSSPDHPPLIVHIVHRLAIGGMENGLVNLINHMPPHRFRHVIVCLSDYTDFRERIVRTDVPVYALGKKEGKDPSWHYKLWGLLRDIRPQIIHTRNLATLEALVPAALSGVKVRVHGEHGREMNDLHGTNKKSLLLRRTLRPLVTRYVAVSKDLERWLHLAVGVPEAKVTQIYNGVDTDRFQSSDIRRPVSQSIFAGDDLTVIGTVGRMQGEKDQTTLTKAFIELLNRDPSRRDRLRLLMVGEGPLRRACEALLCDAQARHLAWLPGARNDVPDLLRSLSVFVLPSLIEGISNTILEAMASGLPVVATEVGGNVELIVNPETGYLVPPNDHAAVADALERIIESPARAREQGYAGRQRVEANFSLSNMVDAYTQMYDRLLVSEARRSTGTAQ